MRTVTFTNEEYAALSNIIADRLNTFQKNIATIEGKKSFSSWVRPGEKKQKGFRFEKKMFFPW